MRKLRFIEKLDLNKRGYEGDTTTGHENCHYSTSFPEETYEMETGESELRWDGICWKRKILLLDTCFERSSKRIRYSVGPSQDKITVKR